MDRERLRNLVIHVDGNRVLIMWDNVKEVISNIAPTLGLALGGPLGGAAGQALSILLTGNKDATAKEISQALSNASPETFAELKKLDLDFKTKMAELGFSEKELAKMDRDSARNREIEMAKSGRRDYILPSLATIVTIGVFMMTYMLFNHQIPDGSKSVFEIMYGNILGIWGVIIAHYFGSSAGSDKQLSKRGDL